ncbi:hypothetical protein [Kordia sp.]|uniref:hypothetical protein n=1 Tax=Kordia sp. TaxID=1965332 RepID=UPI0025BFC5D5|nr:hypothetical protein [Kordia sp.]MCH2194270.1 hypothetical protein [Kordia sp.]
MNTKTLLIRVSGILLLYFSLTSITNAQVGINTTTPGDGSMLDVTSTEKGMLVPRVDISELSTIDPITGGSTESLLVYNTNATTGVGFYYWNNSAWTPVGNPFFWKTTGNSGTTTTNNFLGTTDNSGLRIKTNDLDRFEITAGSTPGRMHAYISGSATSPAYSWQTDSGIGMYKAGINQLGFATNGELRMKIVSTGRVFINTDGETTSQLSVHTNGTGAAQRAIYGSSTNSASGVFGRNTGTGNGVYGFNFGGTGSGVYGQTDTAGGTGVYGLSQSSGYGIHGENTGSGSGIYGLTSHTGSYGVVGENTGVSNNAIHANGNLSASGTKTFKIDHPLDPENRYLKHFSIESNEILNVYRGIATFDANGKAIITMPEYYEAINKNPSYQLTPIGASMSGLFIERELTGGSFVIGGGISGKKVSWQLTAERNDPYLKQNPKERIVEADKGENRGKYLMPDLYNQGKSKEIFKRKQRTSQRN